MGAVTEEEVGAAVLNISSYLWFDFVKETAGYLS